jgi:hypothetical protein
MGGSRELLQEELKCYPLPDLEGTGFHPSRDDIRERGLRWRKELKKSMQSKGCCPLDHLIPLQNVLQKRLSCPIHGRSRPDARRFPDRD